MSRPFAAVIAITLGLPVLAMIALTATGGVKPDFLLTLLLGGVLMGFLVAGIFEIRRLIEVDDGEDSEHDESGAESSTEAELDFLPFESKAKPAVEEAKPIVVPSAAIEEIEVVVPAGVANEVEVTRGHDLAPAAAETDVAPAPPSRPKRKNGGRRKPASAA
jgi:hypothetical protein